jgi:transcriptional regulator with XRE-family HTH domain
VTFFLDKPCVLSPVSGKPVKRFLTPEVWLKILPDVIYRQAVSGTRLNCACMAKRATVKKPPLDFGGETLGERLARLRKERGFTQVEFAEKVGITQVLISSYETDARQFSVEMAIRFALALDISTDELLHPRAKKRRTERKPSLKVMRRMEEIEKLPPREQTAVLTALDTLLRGAVR